MSGNSLVTPWARPLLQINIDIPPLLTGTLYRAAFKLSTNERTVRLQVMTNERTVLVPVMSCCLHCIYI